MTAPHTTDYNVCRNSTRKIPETPREVGVEPHYIRPVERVFQSLFHCQQSRLRHLGNITGFIWQTSLRILSCSSMADCR